MSRPKAIDTIIRDMSNTTGTASRSAKFIAEDIVEILYWSLAKGETDVEVAERFDCRPTTIRAITTGRHYTLEVATAKKLLRRAGLIL